MPERKEKPTGDAYKVVRKIYDGSPGRSWRRLNSALHGALEVAIIAHLSFLEDDFTAIMNDMNGGYWMGNSHGATCGEGFYSLAVKVGHTPACIAFEKYAGRPAALWAEKVKTPERLCIGSEFTWEGQIVTVTNMHAPHLIACSYSQDSGDDMSYTEGTTHYVDSKYRRVDYVKAVQDGSLLVRYSQEVKVDRKPKRVFTIPYAELAARRKKYDATKKAALKSITEAADVSALDGLADILSAAGRGAYRHFDIEEIREAIKAKRETFKESDRAKHELSRLDRWQAGEPLLIYSGSDVRLRIKGAYVETSTGQSASVESVQRVLPIILERRHRPGSCDERVDLHPIHTIHGKGIIVGCTTIAWEEIERIALVLRDQHV